MRQEKIICEGKAKVIAAEEGITELRKYVDTLANMP